MSRYVSRVRKPVRREGAQRYLILTLLSFAASVVMTRLFLELTGYPQLGNAELHIAHVLWGGMLLYAASLLPLIFANRWVYIAGSLLAGIGVGLFIDEVGKFITQSNDYFYPAAAPIIYAFFLLSVLVYLTFRNPLSSDPRAELYRALGGLAEVLDRDLDPFEFQELRDRLQRIADTPGDRSFNRLAEDLLRFLDSKELQLVAEEPDLLERLLRWAGRVETQWLIRSRLKALLAGGLIGLGFFAVLNLGELLLGLRSGEHLQETLAGYAVKGQLVTLRGVIWFTVRVILEGLVGILLFACAVLLLVRREALALRLAHFTLLVSLAVVNLLVFYFEQFSTAIITGIQFSLLFGVMRFRRRFLSEEPNQGESNKPNPEPAVKMR